MKMIEQKRKEHLETNTKKDQLKRRDIFWHLRFNHALLKGEKAK